jgi:hypothetical protein
MRVSQVMDALRQMPLDGQVLVKDASGRWVQVTDLDFSAVDPIYAPTSALLSGDASERSPDIKEQRNG